MKLLKQIPEIQIRYSFRVKKVDRVQVRNSKDLFHALLGIWEHDTLDYREMFIALYLNRCNHVLGYRIISIGGVAGTVVDARQVLPSPSKPMLLLLCWRTTIPVVSFCLLNRILT